MTHCVYEAWMRDVPLYVGVTSNIRKRLAAHRRTQGWWLGTTHFVITHYPTRHEAEVAEWRRIGELRPANNRRVPRAS